MKILCFRNSNLGDYLISIPSLKLIRKKYPNSKIYYLTSKSKNYRILPKIINNTLLVDKFIYFKPTIHNYLILLKKLKSYNFDIFYYLNEKTNIFREIRDFIFFKIVASKKIYGFFSKKINYTKNSETILLAKRVKKNISKLQVVNLNQIKRKKKKSPYKFKYITISIGGFSQPEIWKLDNWIYLICLLLKNKKYKIIILGTKSDYKNSIILKSKNKKRIISLCGKTELDELFTLIQNSTVHITNDNGTMHVSTIFSKKTICLFNNHDPIGKWNPSNKNAIIFRSKNGVNGIKPISVYKKLNSII